MGCQPCSQAPFLICASFALCETGTASDEGAAGGEEGVDTCTVMDLPPAPARPELGAKASVSAHAL